MLNSRTNYVWYSPSSTREPSGTHLNPLLRPDGISLVPWENGKFLAWDVTVADTVAPSYLTSSTPQPGHAASILEARKRLKYKDMLPQYTFQPIGLETLGGVGPSARQLLSKVAKRMRDCELEPRAFDYFLQRISLIIVRSNAIYVLGAMSDAWLHAWLQGQNVT